MTKKSLSICIGRFQPVHLGHIDLIQQSLDEADETLVIMGSAHQALTPRNPFTWQLRAEMLRSALPTDLLSRIHFVPLRDYFDTQRWAEQLSTTVQEFIHRSAIQTDENVTLLGDFSDPSIRKHPHLSSWKPQPRRRFGELSSTLLRDWLFSSCSSSVTAFHAELEKEHQPAAWLHPTTLTFLNDWQKQPIFHELSSEWLVLYNYKRSWLAAPYPPTMVTADVVLRCRDSVLLIERLRPPGKGLLALPGGFIEPNETLYQSALRELVEETSIECPTEQLQQYFKRSCVFDHPERSQRGRIITHAFYFDLGDRQFPKVTAGDDAGATIWTEIDQLSSLEERFHDDHFFILDRFLSILANQDN